MAIPQSATVSAGGIGMWLAVFDTTGDIVASISKRPNMDALRRMLDEHGDEIFADADSVVVEIDMDKDIIKRILRYAESYHKRVFAVVANMSIASQRRDFLQSIDCFVCNVQEAGILFVDDFSGLEPDARSRFIRMHQIPDMEPLSVKIRSDVRQHVLGHRNACFFI